MAEPITVPIETDPQALEDAAYDFIQTYWPGFTPSDTQLVAVVLAVVARMAAEGADVASDVPPAIFRYLGEKIHGVPYVGAAKATVSATVVMVDNAGYTVPQGDVVGIPAAGDELIGFEVTEAVVVPPGSTSTGAGAVSLRALEAGSVGDGLTGTPRYVTQRAYVSSVTLTGPTDGGTDAETVDEYLARLSARLQLQSPRPILPRDFAVLAHDVAGVGRATAIDNYQPNQNEKQQVVIDATGGNYTLTFNGQVTSALAWNAGAAAVQAALEALSNIAPGDVVVTGGPGGTAPLVVEFKGAYAVTNVSLLVASSGSLTGGSGAAVTQVQEALTEDFTAERTVAVAVVEADGTTVTAEIKDQVRTYLESLRETNFAAPVIDPTYTAIDVTWAGKARVGWDPADVQARGNAALAAYLDPALFGNPDDGDPGTPGTLEWTIETVVRYGELYAVLNDVEGLDYVSTLTLRKGAGAFTEANVTLDGVAPLPLAGAIVGTVT